MEKEVHTSHLLRLVYQHVIIRYLLLNLAHSLHP